MICYYTHLLLKEDPCDSRGHNAGLPIIASDISCHTALLGLHMLVYIVLVLLWTFQKSYITFFLMNYVGSSGKQPRVVQQLDLHWEGTGRAS